MPIPQVYYINGVSFSSATAVFLDPELTVCAPDGFYSVGGIVRYQADCVLLPGQACPSCCNEPCSLWHVTYLFSEFTIEYVDCATGSEIQETFSSFVDQDFCVQYGTTPFIVSGDCSLYMVQQCGCCSGEETCNTWNISGIPFSGYADVAYTNCSDIPIVDTFTSNSSFCVKAGTAPVLIDGAGELRFKECGCET
jgi:hypothetical protein